MQGRDLTGRDLTGCSLAGRDLAGPGDTARLGEEIADRLRPGDAVLLDGPLGAGKTVLARALLRRLLGDPGLEVPSPTYTLLQSYDGPSFPVHHFDLWRLENADALPELGWDEARDGAVLVEWPDRLGALWPEDALHLTLEAGEGDRRCAVLRGWEGRL